MIIKVYDYRCGKSILSAEVYKSIKTVLDSIDVEVRRNNVSTARDKIIEQFVVNGWVKNFTLGPETGMNIPLHNRGVGMCIQTGNSARMYADILKLQYLYANEKIKTAVFIVPTKRAARIYSSNMANYEDLVDVIQMYKMIVTIPLTIIGFDERGAE